MKSIAGLSLRIHNLSCSGPIRPVVNEIPMSNQLSITLAPSLNDSDADGIDWDDLSNVLLGYETWRMMRLYLTR